MDPPLVVTGIGVLSSLGSTLGEVWRRVNEEGPCFAPPRRFPAEGARRPLAGELADEAIDAALPSRRFRRLPRYTRIAAAAVTLCLRDLGWKELPPDLDRSRVGLFLGTSRGPLEAVEDVSLDLLHGRPQAVDPLMFQETVLNAPLGHLAVHHRICGPCITLSHGAASALSALAMAGSFLRMERIDLALVSGAESLTPHYYRALADLGVLSARGSMAPYAAGRDGLIVAEGGACVALERAGPLTRRAHAEVAGLCTASDGFCSYANEPGGAGFQLAMAGCLADAGCAPAQVDAVLAAASGERALDRAEHGGLCAVWGDRAASVPVTAPKSAFGDVGAASALFGLALAARTLATGVIPPTWSDGPLDPDLPLNLIRRPTRRAVAAVLVNESSWGGLNGALLLRRAAPGGGASG